MGIWICTSSSTAPGNRRSTTVFQMVLNVEPLGVWKRKAGAGLGPTDLWKWGNLAQQMFTLEGVPNGKVRGFTLRGKWTSLRMSTFLNLTLLHPAETDVQQHRKSLLSHCTMMPHYTLLVPHLYCLCLVSTRRTALASIWLYRDAILISILTQSVQWSHCEHDFFSFYV